MSKIPIEIYNILLKSNAEVLMTHTQTHGQLSLRSFAKAKLKNDRVSDLVQLLWDNIFSKNDRVSDFSRHSRFQSKMLKKRLSLRFGSITMQHKQ